MDASYFNIHTHDLREHLVFVLLEIAESHNATPSLSKFQRIIRLFFTASLFMCFTYISLLVTIGTEHIFMLRALSM